jgi:hypothetical protein
VQYLERTDTISPNLSGAGEARDVTVATHIIDPWPPYLGNRRGESDVQGSPALPPGIVSAASAGLLDLRRSDRDYRCGGGVGGGWRVGRLAAAVGRLAAVDPEASPSSAGFDPG